jgi:uncharacterized membrane protein YkvA (DUF1232 family)
MTSLDSRCLEAFPLWLKSLRPDALKLAAIVEKRELPELLRRGPATALNYLFKSLDLIPDGLEDLGFVDDAFVFRVAARSVPAADAALDASGTVARLAAEAALVEEFLGDVYPRLSAYVNGIGDASVRGRSVGAIVSDETHATELVRDVRQWAEGYQAPAFHRDDKNLVKLRSFLAAKLK